MRSGQEIAGTSPDICEKSSRNLTWAEILERCKASGPAGCSVDAAVAAHRFASERYPCGKIMQNALQAVVLAVASSPEEDRRKLEYLSSLRQQASNAYPMHSHVDMRGVVLAMVSRHLARWARVARQAFRAVDGRVPR